MKKLLIFITLFSTNLYASEVKQFLKLSYDNDPQIMKILNDKSVLKYFVDQGIDNSEVVVTATTETGFVNDQGKNNSTVEAGVSKNFLNTGTEVSLTHSKTLNKVEEGTTSSLRIEQSLLKNAFGSTTRLQIESLGLEKSVKELESAEELEEYILSIINKYLQFKKSLVSLSLAESQLKEAKKLHKNLIEKYKSKVATLADFNRGELLLLNREENLIQKQDEKEQYELELINVTGASGRNLLSKNELDVVLSKLIKLYETKKEQVDKENIRSFIIAKSNIEVSKHNIDLLSDADSASVNLVVGFNKEDTTRFATSNTEDEAVVGLTFSMPIGDSQAKANKSVAQIQKQSFYYQKLKNSSDFDNTLGKLRIDLETQKSKLKLNTKKVKLMDSLLKEETKKYSIGQLSLDELIDIKYDLFELQNDNLEIKVNYISTMLGWFSVTDNLVGIESLL